MTTIDTIHNDDRTVRRVTLDDGTEATFDVDDTGDIPSHKYTGDGDPPQSAVDALEAWLQQYHDQAPPDALPDVDTSSLQEDVDDELDEFEDDGVNEDAPES